MERDSLHAESPLASIIAYLGQLCPADFAFWQEGQTVYYAKWQWVGSIRWPSEAILVQGLRRLSKKLYQTQLVYVGGPYFPPSRMGEGMASHFGFQILNCKRLPAQSQPGGLTFRQFTPSDVMLQHPDTGGTSNWLSPNVTLDIGSTHLHRLYLMAAFSLIQLRKIKVRKRMELGDFKEGEGHNIAALLVNSQGKVEAFGLNATENTTYHAEVNMLQAFAKSRKTFRGTAFIYTTMKPCDMCAAMIAQLLPDSIVIYVQDDPNANGRFIASDRMHLLSQVPGAKQIQLLDEALNKQNNRLIDELARITRTKQRNTKPQEPMYYLTNVIDTEEIFQTMVAGQRGLERKDRKYADPTKCVAARHPEVPTVLWYLKGVLDKYAWENIEYLSTRIGSDLRDEERRWREWTEASKQSQ